MKILEIEEHVEHKFVVEFTKDEMNTLLKVFGSLTKRDSEKFSVNHQTTYDMYEATKNALKSL